MKELRLALASLVLISGCDSWKPVATETEQNGLSVTAVESRINPFFTGSGENTLVSVRILVQDAGKLVSLKAVIIDFDHFSSVGDISDINILCGPSTFPVSQDSVPGGFSAKRNKVTTTGKYNFTNGENLIILKVALNENADLSGKLKVEKLKFILADGSQLPVTFSNSPTYRFAKVLRAAGQDNCNTYRIPGLITTNAGTIIAVYDNRYNGSKDLQEDIDIGMSRSIDKGQTWEPMKVILDMGEYGGRAQWLNGMGDPCILYDQITNTIWVAAMWMSGATPDQMLWWASKPGMSPEETGQFVLVKSTDDGITWSDPINITNQIKNPGWQLLLQGPGRGITTKDGTLVFPAQFKADIGEKAIDGGQYTCHSTIVYSKDGGNTWKIGTGAKSNTTEAQVVQLSDSSLMLNMRDDRNRKDKSDTNGRAVATTKDFGKTWIAHSSSNHSLQEPNCMASLIASDINVSGKLKKVLFFSNPDNKTKRSDMTIKASLDEGVSWPAEYQIRLNQDEGYGYSCLTMVDKNTIGILYEGVKDLFFQKIPISDICCKTKPLKR